MISAITVEYAGWDQLRESVKEAFGVELVDRRDEFSLEELFDALRDKGLDPCMYLRGSHWRVHADRSKNHWSDHPDVCMAGARAAMAWYFDDLARQSPAYKGLSGRPPVRRKTR